MKKKLFVFFSLIFVLMFVSGVKSHAYSGEEISGRFTMDFENVTIDPGGRSSTYVYVPNKFGKQAIVNIYYNFWTPNGSYREKGSGTIYVYDDATGTLIYRGTTTSGGGFQSTGELKVTGNKLYRVDLVASKFNVPYKAPTIGAAHSAEIFYVNP